MAYILFLMSHSWKISSHDITVLVAAPSKGPTVENRETGCNEAVLVWEEISLNSRRGFITNYTIYYTNGNEVHSEYLFEGIVNKL